MTATYRVGGRIPDVMLPRAGHDVPVPARGRPREAVALLFPDDGEAWADYLRHVAAGTGDLADWDGRVIAVAPSGDEGWGRLAEGLGGETWLVHDPDGLLEPATDPAGAATTEVPAAAIVDRYGEVYRVWARGEVEAGPGPEPRELEAWLRYLALQCPE